MSETYTLRITKALNGWVVGSAYHPGALADVLVVKDGESLGDIIAAAIVAEKFKGDPAPKAQANPMPAQMYPMQSAVQSPDKVWRLDQIKELASRGVSIPPSLLESS